MSLATIVITSLGAGITLLTLASQVALWQRKEYRWDRMLDHVRSPEFKNLRTYVIGAAIALLILGWVLYFIGSAVATSIGWLPFITFGLYHISRIVHRGILRPRPTLKAILVALVAATLIGSLAVLLPQTTPVLLWATLNVFVLLLTAVSVGLISIPSALTKRAVIARATAHRARYNPTVIGITGSYGKTSTKQFLYHVLQQYTDAVIATKEHRNAAYPVALDILEQLTPQTKYYVVEMAAYTRGEIGTLARLAQPQVGVVTAIGNQHLSLFGSQEKLAQAKWELIDALPLDGLAVLNADDSVIKKRATTFRGQIIWYSRHQPVDVYATEISYSPTHTELTLHLRDHQQRLHLPLAGEGYVSSALAAAAAALALKVPAEQIAQALQTLPAVPRTMEIQAGQNDATIINDSYTANEAGVLAALTHLLRFPQKNKIVVLLPLLELGSEGPAVHERIGQTMAQNATHVLIAGSSYRDAIERGFAKARTASQLEFISDPKELAKRLTTLANPDSVMLLEGRIPDIARQAVLSTDKEKTSK